MNQTHNLFGLIKMGLSMIVLTALTGCVGYVDGGGGYGGTVVVPGPAVTVYGGGFYERGGDVRGYSHRGIESRAVAHGGGRSEKR